MIWFMLALTWLLFGTVLGILIGTIFDRVGRR